MLNQNDKSQHVDITINEFDTNTIASMLKYSYSKENINETPFKVEKENLSKLFHKLHSVKKLNIPKSPKLKKNDSIARIIDPINMEEILNDKNPLLLDFGYNNEMDASKLMTPRELHEKNNNTEITIILNSVKKFNDLNITMNTSRNFTNRGDKSVKQAKPKVTSLGKKDNNIIQKNPSYSGSSTTKSSALTKSSTSYLHKPPYNANKSISINKNSNNIPNLKKNLIPKFSPEKIIKKKIISNSVPKKKTDVSNTSSFIVMNDNGDDDYKKILNELKCIFGNDFQNFDDDLLFSNLDDQSSKGLIKGLMMLSLRQEYIIKHYEQTIMKLKKQAVTQLKEKDNHIKTLNEQLHRLKFNLQDLISESPMKTKFHKKTPSSKI